MTDGHLCMVWQKLRNELAYPMAIESDRAGAALTPAEFYPKCKSLQEEGVRRKLIDPKTFQFTLKGKFFAVKSKKAFHLKKKQEAEVLDRAQEAAFARRRA